LFRRRLLCGLRREAIIHPVNFEYLRGDEYLERFTHEANEQARRMFEKAIERDPQCARAYALLGVTYEREWGMQWSRDPQTLEQAFTLAQKALTLDDSLPVARLVLGNIYQWKKQPEQAIAEFEQAIALDPNDADSHVQLADILNGVGRPEEALGLVEKAMRLNPDYPSEYLFHLGWAYASTGRYEEAITAFKRALTRNPDFLPAHLALAAMYSGGGREAEARAAVAEVLRLSPDFSVEVLRQMLPATDQAGVERVLDLLRQVGLK
jgi:adenylate cyclase